MGGNLHAEPLSECPCEHIPVIALDRPAVGQAKGEAEFLCKEEGRRCQKPLWLASFAKPLQRIAGLRALAPPNCAGAGAKLFE